MQTQHRVFKWPSAFVVMLNDLIRMSEKLMSDDEVVKLGSLSVDRQLYPLIDNGLDLLSIIKKLRKDLTPMADGQAEMGVGTAGGLPVKANAAMGVTRNDHDTFTTASQDVKELAARFTQSDNYNEVLQSTVQAVRGMAADFELSKRAKRLNNLGMDPNSPLPQGESGKPLDQMSPVEREAEALRDAYRDPHNNDPRVRRF